MSLQWNASLATGVAEIDDQHQELIKRINNLLDAMRAGNGKEIIEKVVSFLDEYVVIHFGTEEKYMAQYNYPELASHKEQHQSFTGYFNNLKKELASEGPTSALVIQAQRKLSEWWENHIGGVDKELGGFLQGKL
jgi:hemerythrin